MKIRMFVLSFFFAVLLSGCTDMFSELEASDILSEPIMLHTGEATIIHRGDCKLFKKKWNTNVVNIEDYIKHKDHYYCNCLNDSLMDEISIGNAILQMALDGYFAEYYSLEYEGEIYKRMKQLYNTVEGNELQYVWGKGGFSKATDEDRRMLREFEKERYWEQFKRK